VVGAMSVVFFSSGLLYAQEAPPVDPSVISPVSDASSLMAVRRQAVTNAMQATNATPAKDDLVDAWAQFSSAVEVPGSHHVTTNAAGVPIHRFNMVPVVTNMTALTNDLPQLEQKQAALDQEMKDLPQRLSLLRDSVIQDSRILANISTNFVPADVEGKKVKERMEALINELNQLRAEYKKRLEADADFQKAKARYNEDLAAFQALQDRKGKLREERGALNPKIWAINELKRRELNRQASTNEPKAVAP